MYTAMQCNHVVPTFHSLVPSIDLLFLMLFNRHTSEQWVAVSSSNCFIHCWHLFTRDSALCQIKQLWQFSCLKIKKCEGLKISWQSVLHILEIDISRNAITRYCTDRHTNLKNLHMIISNALHTNSINDIHA